MGNTRFKLGTRNNGPIASGQKKIEIVTPHDNDRFVISPFKKDKILFRAVPEPVSSHITWMMNGYEIAKTPAPYEFSWIPQRGTHVVHAITPDNLAAKITITVE
jgi:membrane carboxypeptidase/penicillin-binding protein PbpC